MRQAQQAQQQQQQQQDEGDESVKQLRECAPVYELLQACLIKTDRDWKSCQQEVKALKACHDQRKATQRRSTSE